MALVVLVILVFLQSWRTAVIPIIAIPVSLIGTCAVMAALGFSLNTLTLFGMVLAIGIVVDDAIVVVENVERNIARGHVAARCGARDHGRGRHRGDRHRARAGARCSSRPPSFPGITGQFYRQFALTIAVSTVISAFISLTLSPALAALLLKPHSHEPSAQPARRASAAVWPDGFNRGFDRLSHGYAAGRSAASCGASSSCCRSMPGLLAATVWIAEPRAARLHPDPRPGLCHRRRSSCRTGPRCRAPTRSRSALREIARETPGAQNAVAFAGFSGATFTNATNSAAIFVSFKPFEERLKEGLTARRHHRRPVRAHAADRGGVHHRHPAAAGARPRQFRRLQDAGPGAHRLRRAPRSRRDLRADGPGPPEPEPGRRLHDLLGEFAADLSWRSTAQKARMLNVPIANIFETLQHNLGTAYVNDFNAFGRVYQVRAQADQRFRLDARGYRAAARALVDRRARAAGNAGRDPGHDGPRSGPALQHVHLGAAAGERGARRLFGRRRSTPWSSLRARRCRRA